MKRFTQKIYKIGINPLVDPPEQVLIELFEQAGRAKGPIPVSGTINGASFIQTLIRYKGAWRLYINSQMLKDADLTVGDTARIEIEFDPRPRDEPVHQQLANALAKDPVAYAEFEKLPPSRRKEIARYLNSLKSEEAVRRNVERVLGHLLASRSLR